jgi:uncharacterized protein
MNDPTRSEASEPNDLFEEEMVSWVRNDRLHLILLPTERCNFRCTYCYEDFSIGRMSAETIQGIKRLIDSRLGSLESLCISWFGGEPLLARSVVEEVSEHAVRLAAERPDLVYEGDMTTNGFLLDTVAVERLARLGIGLFQISLDGPEPLHNGTRVRGNGKGSFREIWRNLLAIRDGSAPVSVLLRIHLTPANLPVMPDFLLQVRETFLHDGRFRVLLKPVERLGGPNDATMKIVPQETRAGILAHLESIVANGDGGAQRLFSAPHVCYASRPNSLVIRADGRVGKCTVALSDPANTIGSLRPDGSLDIDNDRLRPWLRGWASRDWETIGCPYATFPRSLQNDPAYQGGPPKNAARRPDAVRAQHSNEPAIVAASSART